MALESKRFREQWQLAEAEFHSAVGAWLDRELPKRRPFGEWRPVATVLSVEEMSTLGGWLSDVTSVSPETLLTITWLDDAGERHTIADEWMLTDLINELDSQTPARPWQRVSHRREVLEDGTVIDFGVNDVRW